MTSTTRALPTRDRRVLADLLPKSLLMDIVLVLAGAGLTGLLAQWTIPFTPVPMTGQTLAVLLVGASLGAVRGSISMVVYVGLGLVGLPWFADGASGYPAATFGYLLGFILAAGLLGTMTRRGSKRSFISMFWAMVAAEVVIYVLGVTWLKVDLGVSWELAIAYGFTPFIFGDMVKAVVAGLLLPVAWHVVDRTEQP